MKNLLKQKKLALTFLFFISCSVQAQNLIPATTDDQEAFDQQLEELEAKKEKPPARQSVDSVGVQKNNAANFGSAVQEEAKKLKGADSSTRQQMGQRVSEQKRKNSSGAGNASGSSANSDGRSSSPKFNNAGGAPNAPGQSGNRKK